jgi:plastocyanin
MRKLASRTLLCLLVAAPAASVAAATITGKVVLMQDGKPRTDAANAVVWIEGVPRGAEPRAQMKSASKRFEPHVIVVPTNTTVEFPNVDPIYHNVFSVSAGNRFDLGLYRSGASKSKKFDEPGLVRVYCNIHPQMIGFVVVVDSGAWAITGPDGSFRIDNVPSGTHTLKAWHEDGGAETSQPIAVKGSGEPPVSISIDVSGATGASHKNKYGKDYKPPPSDTEDERY